MKKLFKLSLIALLCSLAINAKAQLADVSFNVRVDRMEHYEGGVGGNCWETGDEEYTGFAGFSDNVDGTVTWTGCQTGSANGNATYGQNVFIGSRTNNADRIDPTVDGWEDDAGDRCVHNSGDDCRTGPGDRGDIFFRLLASPSASGSYNINAVGGFGDGDFRVWYDIDWRYSGTANALYPDCRTQSTAYSAGGIRSWSVYMVAGRTYRFGSCGTAEDTYLRIFSGDGYTNVANFDDNGPLCTGAAASGNYTAPTTGWYYVELSRYSRSALTAGGTLTYEDVTAPPTPPATFGNGTWYTTAYTGGNIDLTGEYSGYYSETALSYNSLDRWGTNGSPSDASGWQGCYVPVDNHVVVSRRTGFACGVYQFDMPNHDDDVRVYVNGSQVFTHVGCCDAHTNLWTGYLTSTSTIEVRHLEGGGGSHQSLTLTPVTPTLVGGTIGGIADGTVICFNTDPGAFTNTGSPSGGTIGITNGSPAAPVYQWQRATNATFTAGLTVVGSNSLSYDPAADAALIGGTYYYRRRVTDACGNIAYSNVISIVVRPQFSAGSISGTGQTICYNGNPASIGSIATASGGDGVITYKWQANGVDIVGATGATYDPPPGLTTTTTYTRWASDGTCNTSFTSSANTHTVIVIPQLIPSATATLAQCADPSNPYAELVATTPGAGIAGIWTKPNATHAGTITDPANASTVITGLSTTGGTTQVRWTLYYTSGTACSTATALLSVTPPNMANLTTVSVQNDGAATSTGTPAQTRYMCRTCSVKNGNTYTYFDASGRIVATIVDKTTNGADLGTTEVCIGYDYSPPTPPTSANVKTIIDNRGYTQPYLPRSWTIKPAAGSDATVTLYFTAAELTALQTRAATTPYIFSGLDLAVTKYPGGIGGGQFIAPKSVGGVFTPSLFGSYNTGYQVTFDVNSFSTFYVHPQTFPFAVLPVELTSFTGYHESLRNTLIWKTASEKNTDRFEIEKSFDGVKWEHIGTQKAVGNTNGESAYTFYDNAPKVGNNYYRLKIADYDQSYEYSKVINVVVGATEMENSISVYPNPTSGDVTMMVYSLENRSGRIQVVNVLGQVMIQEEVSLQKGSTDIPIRLQGLSNGLYTIIFSDVSGKTYTEKVLKQ